MEASNQLNDIMCGNLVQVDPFPKAISRLVIYPAIAYFAGTVTGWFGRGHGAVMGLTQASCAIFGARLRWSLLFGNGLKSITGSDQRGGADSNGIGMTCAYTMLVPLLSPAVSAFLGYPFSVKTLLSYHITTLLPGCLAMRIAESMLPVSGFAGNRQLDAFQSAIAMANARSEDRRGE